jgi:hypothetical protein
LVYPLLGTLAAGVGDWTPDELTAALRSEGSAAILGVQVVDMLRSQLARTVRVDTVDGDVALVAFAHDALLDEARQLYAGDLPRLREALLNWCHGAVLRAESGACCRGTSTGTTWINSPRRTAGHCSGVACCGPSGDLTASHRRSTTCRCRMTYADSTPLRARPARRRSQPGSRPLYLGLGAGGDDERGWAALGVASLLAAGGDTDRLWEFVRTPMGVGASAAGNAAVGALAGLAE